MRRTIAIISAAAMLLAAGCANQVHNRTVDPFKSRLAGEGSIRTVAILPFLLPEYIRPDQSGGEGLSIEMTNDFMLRLANLGVYAIMDGADVSPVLKARAGTERAWLFEGDDTLALAIGRDLKVDGVFVGRIKRFITSNLVDSQVEIELSLIDCKTGRAAYTISSNMVGKSGSRSLNQNTSVPSADVLAREAVVDLVAQISDLTGQKKVARRHTLSNRRLVAYSLLATGIASASVGVYFYTEANAAYDEYKNSDDNNDLTGLKKKTETYDQVWQAMTLISLGTLGTSAYLFLTDNPNRAFDESALGRYDILLGPYENGASVFILVRFK